MTAATGGIQHVHVVTSWVTKDSNENKERQPGFSGVCGNVKIKQRKKKDDLN